MLRLLNIVLIISLCAKKNAVIFFKWGIWSILSAYFIPVIAAILEKDSLHPRSSSPG